MLHGDETTTIMDYRTSYIHNTTAGINLSLDVFLHWHMKCTSCTW